MERNNCFSKSVSDPYSTWPWQRLHYVERLRCDKTQAVCHKLNPVTSWVVCFNCVYPLTHKCLKCSKNNHGR